MLIQKGLEWDKVRIAVELLKGVNSKYHGVAVDVRCYETERVSERFGGP